MTIRNSKFCLFSLNAILFGATQFVNFYFWLKRSRWRFGYACKVFLFFNNHISPTKCHLDAVNTTKNKSFQEVEKGAGSQYWKSILIRLQSISTKHLFLLNIHLDGQIVSIFAQKSISKLEAKFQTDWTDEDVLMKRNFVVFGLRTAFGRINYIAKTAFDINSNHTKHWKISFSVSTLVSSMFSLQQKMFDVKMKGNSCLGW